LITAPGCPSQVRADVATNGCDKSAILASNPTKSARGGGITVGGWELRNLGAGEQSLGQSVQEFTDACGKRYCK
jgi:hypothetical protein